MPVTPCRDALTSLIDVEMSFRCEFIFVLSSSSCLIIACAIFSICGALTFSWAFNSVSRPKSFVCKRSSAVPQRNLSRIG